MGDLLAHLAVVAAVAGIVLAPWPLAVRAARRNARRQRGALGLPQDEVRPPEREGEAVTLRGRLEAEAPCEAFEGGPVAAATAVARIRRHTVGEAHMRGNGLWLEVDGDRVRLEGPVVIRSGSHETRPRQRLYRLPAATATRVHGAAEPTTEDLGRARMTFRSVPSGGTVRVRGRLEREVRDDAEGGYREGAARWRLLPIGQDAAGDGDAEREPALELASEATPRVRIPPRGWIGRALVLGGLLLGLLPWGLGEVGDELRGATNAALRDCDPGGFVPYLWADRVLVAQTVFPGWAATARASRVNAVGSAVNGVKVCAIGDAVPPEMLEQLELIARERLAEVADAEGFDAERGDLESALHEHGRDRAIVRLQAHLPRGGDVEERVRAHFYLGDLEGAAATWKEPGAHIHPRYGNEVLQKGNVLCMHGDYEPALAAFEKLAETRSKSEYDFRKIDFFARYGECAVRAGDRDRVERIAQTLEQIERGDAAAAWLRARDAVERDAPVAVSETWGLLQERPAGALLGVWLLAREGRWRQLLDRIGHTRLAHHLHADELDARLYNTIYNPVLDLGLLEELAELTGAELAARQERSAGASDGDPAGAGSGDADSGGGVTSRSEVGDPAGVGSGDEKPTELRRLRELAGELQLALALRRARRWDPAAERCFARARELLGPDDPRPERLQHVFAFYHGRWELPEDRALAELRRIGRAYDDPAVDVEPPDRAPRLGLAVLNPSGLVTERMLVQLRREATLPDAHKLELLRVQRQEAPLPTLFYRLTLLVVHGADFGADPERYRGQLADLRAMLDAQPNPYLVTGYLETTRL